LKNPITALQESGYQLYYCGLSALDRYFRLKPGDFYLLTDSSLIALAQTFEELSYPGMPYEDAVLTLEGTRYVFSCYDDIEPPNLRPYTVEELLYDPQVDTFFDPRGIYPDLRGGTLVSTRAGSPLLQLTEAAKLISRYHYQADLEDLDRELPQQISIESQRQLLLCILSAPHPYKGLSLLYQSGFVQTFWPELFTMTHIPHVKDFHPEGNGWEHVLETFRYRKTNDPVLSLGLLLHDIGKPAASGSRERPFDGHAEIGANIARRFLRRLQFSESLIDDVAFLVRFHMMPAALKKLPLYRSERIMNSPLFPLLLELYRADLSSSYWSPEGYYEACRIYRSYQKNRANPYRRKDGSRR